MLYWLWPQTSCVDQAQVQKKNARFGNQKLCWIGKEPFNESKPWLNTSRESPFRFFREQLQESVSTNHVKRASNLKCDIWVEIILAFFFFFLRMNLHYFGFSSAQSHNSKNTIATVHNAIAISPWETVEKREVVFSARHSIFESEINLELATFHSNEEVWELACHISFHFINTLNDTR